MKNKLKDGLQIFVALLFTGSTAFAMQPPAPTTVPQSTETAVVQEQASQKKAKKPQEKPAKASKPKKAVTWRDNPQNCSDDEWIAKERPFECIKKPKTNQSAVAATTKSAPVSASGSGSCAAEIAKYSWNQSVALAVAQAESDLNPGIVNDNPATGDYSVGCFQVNLFGANAYSRPSEAQLKNAAVNVQWAYNNYVANGSSFIGQWGVCNGKVSCY